MRKMEWLLGFNISNLKYYKLTPCTLFFSVQNNNFARENETAL